MSTREQLEGHLGRPTDAMAVTRAFLRSRFADAESLDEVRRDIAQSAVSDSRRLITVLQVIEDLLRTPPEPPGTLLQLVAWDANWSVEDETDAGAAGFLAELADILRQALRDRGRLPG